MGKLYTIGHSTHPIGYFEKLLRTFDIQYVLDVRSTPYSQYASQYNQDVLKTELKGKNIVYAPMGLFFGARQPDRTYYPEGYLDFEKYRESELFIKGRDNVCKGLETYNIALMCTEKRPIDCHRAVMVARGFELIGVEVNHILQDGSLISQEELNEQLLELYFPERNQLSFLEEENKSDEQRLQEAYRKQNKKIGYKWNSGWEGERK